MYHLQFLYMLRKNSPMTLSPYTLDQQIKSVLLRDNPNVQNTLSWNVCCHHGWQSRTYYPKCKKCANFVIVLFLFRASFKAPDLRCARIETRGGRLNLGNVKVKLSQERAVLLHFKLNVVSRAGKEDQVTVALSSLKTASIGKRF